MSMVRVAQGNPIMLMSEDCQSILEVSSDLMTAVNHCRTVHGWEDNLSGEEMPPRWMWPFPEELSEWFEEVQMARDKKYNINSNSDDDSGSDMAKNTFFDD